MSRLNFRIQSSRHENMEHQSNFKKLDIAVIGGGIGNLYLLSKLKPKY